MNKWKLLFFILLSINLAVLLIGISFFLQPYQEIEKPDPTSFRNNQPAAFIVQSNKNTLNTYINDYIVKTNKNSPLHYTVVLEDEVKLTGTIEIFKTNVPFLLTFEPEVTNDGNLLLRQKRMLLGQFELPVPFVLSYIEKNYQFPHWVSVYPNDQSIHLRVTDLKIAEKFNINIRTFNLDKDQIIFRLATE